MYQFGVTFSILVPVIPYVKKLFMVCLPYKIVTIETTSQLY